ncbi:hypothetical protein, partial [Saccharibacter floricola]
GDSNAAKIDLLMGAISATGLDVKAFHLVGTGLSDVGKSVLHYMQSEGGAGAGAGAIIGGGGKKALAEGEKTTEKTLEKESESPLSGKEKETIWDRIYPTQNSYEGNPIPRSFNIETDKGRFWVANNGTKHMNEIVASTIKRMSEEGVDGKDLVNINSQQVLRSFGESLNNVVRGEFKYGEKLTDGSWEFIIGPPKKDGLNPAIFHALRR